MSHRYDPRNDSDPAAGGYEIRLAGRLHERWAAWFDGLSVRYADDGTTVISGPIADQSALHGLLQRVRDLGLALISVERLEADPSDGPDTPTADQS
jgi:hypothetical protein